RRVDNCQAAATHRCPGLAPAGNQLVRFVTRFLWTRRGGRVRVRPFYCTARRVPTTGLPLPADFRRGKQGTMADYRAIAAVSEAIIHLLEREYDPADFNGHPLQFRVFLARDFSQPMDAGVSLFL